MEQHAKKVMSDILGLVDFVVGLVGSILHFPISIGRVKILITEVLWGIKLLFQFLINYCASEKILGGLVQMTVGLVHPNYSLP